MEEKKSSRGGRRQGAGRKKLENGRNVRASFMLSTQAAQTLERLAAEQSTTKNDIINHLLEAITPAGD